MKVNFNGKQQNTQKVEAIGGSYEDMLKKREQELPRIEGNINEILEGYSGETLVIIRILEDENGDPEGAATGIFGVGGLKSQLKMGKVLNTAKDKMIDLVLEAAKQDPDVLLHVLKHIAEEKIKEKK